MTQLQLLVSDSTAEQELEWASSTTLQPETKCITNQIRTASPNNHVPPLTVSGLISSLG